MGNAESSDKAQAQRAEQHQPSALVIVGPSGVGKGTLINKLMAGNDRYGFSCSHTTRAPRQGEKDGVHYHFTSKPDMEKEIADGQFLEHAHVHGNIYGTSVAAVREVAANGKCCILDIDVQGARQVRESGLRAIFVFVAPPSLAELETRLRGRGTEAEEAVQKRLTAAKDEISSMEEDGLYDYVIVNDELDKAFEELSMIAERALAGEIGAAPEHLQAQTEAEAERDTKDTGDGGAAAAPHTEADSGRGNHAGGDDGRHAEQEDQQEEEEALLQQSSPTASAPQGLERWRGKVALVTGASAGIGWAVCEALALAGLRVVAVARRRERLEQLQQTLVAAGVPIADFLPVVCDITKVRLQTLITEAEVVALPRIIVKRWPEAGVDVLINNAGLGRNNASLWEGSTASWVEMISINVLGVCMCTREAIQDMKRRGQYGHIINISSMSGHRVPNGASGGAFYAATKHALRALTEGLRQEARAHKVNLRVTAISPGMVETEFYQVSHFNDKTKTASTPYQNMKCLQAEDIAQAVTWALAAPDHVDVNDILIRPVEQSS